MTSSWVGDRTHKKHPLTVSLSGRGVEKKNRSQRGESRGWGKDRRLRKRCRRVCCESRSHPAHSSVSTVWFGLFQPDCRLQLQSQALSEPAWPYTLLLITPTHNRSAVQLSAQNIDVCGACGGDHAKQIALGGISRSPVWDESSSESCIYWYGYNMQVCKWWKIKENLVLWWEKAYNIETQSAADMRKLIFLLMYFFLFAPQGCLPLVLMFDIKEDIEVEPQCITALMEQLDVFISIKPKPKQPSKVQHQAYTHTAWKVVV